MLKISVPTNENTFNIIVIKATTAGKYKRLIILIFN